VGAEQIFGFFSLFSQPVGSFSYLCSFQNAQMIMQSDMQIIGLQLVTTLMGGGKPFDYQVVSSHYTIVSTSCLVRFEAAMPWRRMSFFLYNPIKSTHHVLYFFPQ
jgi:hypothetical protein